MRKSSCVSRRHLNSRQLLLRRDTAAHLISICDAYERRKKTSKRTDAAVIDRVIAIESARESEAETEVRDLIAVGERPAGPVVAQSQTSTKPTAARPLPRGSVTIASQAWPKPCCQTVGLQTDMIFIGTGTEIGTGIATATATAIENETVTEIASETGIVTVMRIVPLALAVTTRLTDMSASAATAKRNVSAPTAAVSSKRMWTI